MTDATDIATHSLRIAGMHKSAPVQMPVRVRMPIPVPDGANSATTVWQRIAGRMARPMLAAAALAFAGPTVAEEPLRLRIGQEDRTYVSIGTAATAAPAKAAVIVLHGGGGSAAQVRGSFGMDEIAAREGLIVAYPDGIARSWNDGRAELNVPRRGKAPADDVAFISELAKRLARDVPGGRVFVTGISNGGMLTYRLACETESIFAGFAAVIANLSVDLAATCSPRQPRHLLIMNGTADRLMPWDGGKVTVLGWSRGTVLPALDTFMRWRDWNRCSGVAQADVLVDREPADGSRVEIIRATGCPAGGETVLYRIKGGGHQVPRRTPKPLPLLDRYLGATNRDIDAADEIWRFFASSAPGVNQGRRQ